MKVSISTFVEWIGPYQLARKITLGLLPEKYEHAFGDWLADINWLCNFLQWNYNRKERRIKVHIDRWDLWSLDYSLAYIIVPALKKFKDELNGCPVCLEDVDLPPHIVNMPEDDSFSKYHAGWEWMINEMIEGFEFTFKQHDLDETHTFAQQEEMAKNAVRQRMLFAKYFHNLWR